MGKKGQTPLIREGCRYKHLSTISAIGPKSELYYQIQETSYNGIDTVNFIRNLLIFFQKRWLIIWDGAKIDADANVKAFLENENNDRVFLSKIPALNADEQVWQALKDNMLKNVVCKSISELKAKLITAFEELKIQKSKVANFFRHPDVE
jgi:transposase